MAKGDGTFGSQKPLIGQSNFRQKMPMSDTNEMGEQKPTGWQHLINPQFMGSGGSAPDQQMPQKSMFQNMGNMGNTASNIGMMMGNRFGQQKPSFGGQGMPFQSGGFNVGPSFGGNRGINPGGMYSQGPFGGGRRFGLF